VQEAGLDTGVNPPDGGADGTGLHRPVGLNAESPAWVKQLEIVAAALKELNTFFTVLPCFRWGENPDAVTIRIRLDKPQNSR
jgi:hypothetical protein